MFEFARPTSDDVDHALEQYRHLHLHAELLDRCEGLLAPRLATSFAHDLSESKLGIGRQVFDSAASAFKNWNQFDLGWVRVANQDARIAIGQIVAVEVCALGLWSLNLSQVVSVISGDDAFGFIYKTSPQHAEEGEERFLLTFNPSTEEVHYKLEAVSRPQHWFPRLGYPFTRHFQHRFARESHLRVQRTASESDNP